MQHATTYTYPASGMKGVAFDVQPATRNMQGCNMQFAKLQPAMNETQHAAFCNAQQCHECNVRANGPVDMTGVQGALILSPACRSH